jgi:hypothetical protein
LSLFFSEPLPPYRNTRPRRNDLKSFAGGGAHRSGANGGTRQTAGDPNVVELFSRLQKAWRHQGTLRRTYDGMPSSREERDAWSQLIKYLTRAPGAI